MERASIITGSAPEVVLRLTASGRIVAQISLRAIFPPVDSRSVDVDPFEQHAMRQQRPAIGAEGRSGQVGAVEKIAFLRVVDPTETHCLRMAQLRMRDDQRDLTLDQLRLDALAGEVVEHRRVASHLQFDAAVSLPLHSRRGTCCSKAETPSSSEAARPKTGSCCQSGGFIRPSRRKRNCNCWNSAASACGRLFDLLAARGPPASA